MKKKISPSKPHQTGTTSEIINFDLAAQKISQLHLKNVKINHYKKFLKKYNLPAPIILTTPLDSNPLKENTINYIKTMASHTYNSNKYLIFRYQHILHGEVGVIYTHNGTLLPHMLKCSSLKQL